MPLGMQGLASRLPAVACTFQSGAHAHARHFVVSGGNYEATAAHAPHFTVYTHAVYLVTLLSCHVVFLN